jgi:hypothetical protein
VVDALRMAHNKCDIYRKPSGGLGGGDFTRRLAWRRGFVLNAISTKCCVRAVVFIGTSEGG